tara:strand:+ start:4130 stop:4810 length:681 start_codon:yes stop_codon:yes gene_type:complete
MYIKDMSKTTLQVQYIDDKYIEIGIDEAGRGPMFGRVYAAAVVLSTSDNYKHKDMKDSKRFHSEKKINAVADYIKENSVAWAVSYAEASEIDEYNIRIATHKAMHKAIEEIMNKLSLNYGNTHLLVDGNDFTPIMKMHEGMFVPIRYTTIEQGDNKITNIAAASILAKVERDKYIGEICQQNPILDEHYGLLKNKGYGTAQHIQGIKDHGITEFHRKTFGICRQFA